MNAPALKTLLLSTARASTAALFLAASVRPALADGDSGVETVVVTARVQASKVKQEAPNVLDARSQEEIRSLPDVSAAEALQRVPGISMEADTGEGRFINIRGLDADLNGTTYDGVRLTASNPASPQGGSRAVAFDAFPAGILGGLEVFKSLTPEMDAEGLGGVINIVPRALSADQSWLVNATLGSGIETLRSKPVFQGDITAGTRFGLTDGDDRFSVIGSYAIYDDQRGIDDLEEAYANNPPDKTFDNLQMRFYKYHRTRQGYGGGFTFDVDNNTTLYVRGLHAGYTELAFKHYLVLTNLGSATGGPNGPFTGAASTVLMSVTDTKENVGNNVIDLGGHTQFGPVVADFRGSWTRGDDRFIRGLTFHFTDPNPVAIDYNNANPKYPSFQTTDGTDLTNASNYTDFSASNTPGANTDTEWAGKADFSIPAAFDDNNGVIKLGGSIRERELFADAFAADVLPPGGSYANFSRLPDRIYYANHYNIGPSPDFTVLAALPESPLAEQPASFQHNNENVYAGYAQYRASFDALDVLGGVRVEATDASYRAHEFVNGTDEGVVTSNRSYTNAFPDLDLTYHINDTLQVRGDYSTAIARPGFNQITAAISVDTGSSTVTEGNPALKATTANAFDLSLEYFMPDGGLASVGVFWKLFDNYIVQTQQNNVTFHVPGTAIILNNATITSFSDIGAARAGGVELNLIQRLAFLPDPLDGLGFEGNLTLIGSSGQIRPGSKHTLPQTSPFNYNVALFYDKGPLTLRLAGAFVSKNIFAVGGDANSDVYSQPRFRLDFGGSYKVCDDLLWYVDVKNITNTLLEFTQTPDRNFPIQREFYGPTFLTGVRIALNGPETEH